MSGTESGVALPDGGTDREPTLSVVVVTRNEADRIETCLDSVFAACRAVESFEVILVDSNSTDGTVERARTYPITVLRIPTDDLTTPAAGRYVGTRHASADTILFVDGDMELASGWLPAALGCLRSDEDVAAVDGLLAAAGNTDSREDAKTHDPPDTDAVESVDAVRGVALYDAGALADVGGFDPHLRSLEDVHLGFELVEAGYRLCRLPRIAATHPASQPVTEPFRRWRRGYAVGIGQALRQSLASPAILRRHLSRMRYRVAASLWLGAGALATRDRSWLAAWFLASSLGLVALTRKLGPLEALTFSIDKLVGTVGVAVGVWIPPAEPESYPVAAIEVVTRGTVHRDVRQPSSGPVRGTREP